MSQRRVVVTGMGAVTPLGLDVPSYWEGLKNGVSGANMITHFDTTHFKTKFACELKGFNALDYFHRKEARKMDTFCQYAMVAADEAMSDAKFDLEATDMNRFGVVFTSGIGGMNVFYDEVKSFVEGSGTPRFNPFFITKMIIDLAAGNISIKHGLKGPNYATVSACASSTNAIIDAVMLIKMGYADVIMAGGAEAAINEVGIGGFNAMKALSENNDNYKTASRPFDKNRDGFVMGEGAGALIIEDYEHAVKRGAHIYAEIVGMGLSADAYHISAPSLDGVVRVMNSVLQDAGVTTADVDYLNVHGTSTPVGDVNESNAVKEVFGEDAYKMNISSTKSMTGHLLGAAGAIESIATILAMKHSLIPPTINHSEADPDCDLNYTFNKAQARDLKYAMSNTFGFGGHNATVLFKKIEG
ncbi:MAG: beta-ketoacyl-ACP synthase II [Bacteroidia bacterium]